MTATLAPPRALNGHDALAQGEALGFKCVVVPKPCKGGITRFTSLSRSFRASFVHPILPQGCALCFRMSPFPGLVKSAHEQIRKYS
jgi:hypothetical protein